MRIDQPTRGRVDPFEPTLVVSGDRAHGENCPPSSPSRRPSPQVRALKFEPSSSSRQTSKLPHPWPRSRWTALAEAGFVCLTAPLMAATTSDRDSSARLRRHVW